MKQNVLTPDKKKEGAGAEVRRLFPSSSLTHVDPFVLLDEFFVEADSGFPMHRHAGFEAITYILGGGFRHKDDMGNDSVVGEGGVQKFTAGSGIEHSEMPAGEKGAHGFQLWLNLPKNKKDMKPNYQKVKADKIPQAEDGKTIIKTIVGEDSPVELETNIKYQDVALEKDCFTSIDFSEKHRGFLYVYQGEISLKEENGTKTSIAKGQGYLPDGTLRFSIGCAEDSRFIVVSGEPIGEEIKLEGSIVR
ncbi:MAG: pirin family protein [Candidatus Thermoplasmatota archaeon]